MKTKRLTERQDRLLHLLRKEGPIHDFEIRRRLAQIEGGQIHRTLSNRTLISLADRGLVRFSRGGPITAKDDHLAVRRPGWILTEEGRRPSVPDKISLSGKAKTKKKRAHPEHDIQAALIKATKRAIARLEPLAEKSPAHANARLALSLLHAIPNGSSRHPAEAQRLRLEGVKAGIPDLFLPAARMKYHGLYLETKAPKGSLSDTQREVISLLIDQGYRIEEYRHPDAGIRAILRYLYAVESEAFGAVNRDSFSAAWSAIYGGPY